jgi:hypothetical protein
MVQFATGSQQLIQPNINIRPFRSTLARELAEVNEKRRMSCNYGGSIPDRTDPISGDQSWQRTLGGCSMRKRVIVHDERRRKPVQHSCRPRWDTRWTSEYSGPGPGLRRNQRIGTEGQCDRFSLQSLQSLGRCFP